MLQQWSQTVSRVVLVFSQLALVGALFLLFLDPLFRRQMQLGEKLIYDENVVMIADVADDFPSQSVVLTGKEIRSVDGQEAMTIREIYSSVVDKETVSLAIADLGSSETSIITVPIQPYSTGALLGLELSHWRLQERSRFTLIVEHLINAAVWRGYSPYPQQGGMTNGILVTSTAFYTAVFTSGLTIMLMYTGRRKPRKP